MRSGNNILNAAPLPGGSLDPTTIPKYKTTLVIPPAMPNTSIDNGVPYYEIAVRQFSQQILPPAGAVPAGFPATTVWGYGSVNHPGTFNYPSLTIEARVGTPVRVKWMNQLVDGKGNYLPHLLPVDQTIHWANPGGKPTDSNGTSIAAYQGPVPMIPHLHGGHSPFDSDGYPEAWWLPAAKNLGSYSPKGMRYQSPYGSPDDYKGGFAVFQYPNDQRAGTNWYHDHTLGMTRLNVYAGPAGFYNLRGGSDDLATGLPGPAPQIGDKPGTRYYEIPIAIQDRCFNSDGSLFYPTRAPIPPGAPPLWVPEFFGNTVVVNGRTWPVLEVEKRRYRFRLLNGCQSRALLLKLRTSSGKNVPFWVIGTEGGFLPTPVNATELLMGNAERMDVIVDFTDVSDAEVLMINEGPDGPLGSTPGIADPDTTGQVMKFKLVPAVSADKSKPPEALKLPAFKALPATDARRQAALFERLTPAGESLGVLLGTPAKGPLMWDAPITETPSLGATEIWEIYNTTGDTHPIHLHQVMFQVVERQEFSPADFSLTPGTVTPPRPTETGYKDTVLVPPGQVARVKARFDLPNLYVWHCHIVEHEDNEMMRPYTVLQNPAANLGPAMGYSILTLKDAAITLTDGASRIYGDVGIGPFGLQKLSQGTITGTVFMSPTADPTKVNAKVTGGVVSRNLNAAVAAVNNAAAALWKLTPNSSLGMVNATKKITAAKRGLNVVKMDALMLNDGGQTLTISGQAGDEFVINIDGKMQLWGAKVVLTGGVLPSRVLFNLRDSAKIEGRSVVLGLVLNPANTVSLDDGSSVTGGVCSGGDVSIANGSWIRLV